MYRIIKAAGYDGTDKLETIAAIHSLEGRFFMLPHIGGSIWFVYNDSSGQMMHSSLITDLKKVNEQLHIKTLNTEYWFEKVEG